MPRVALSRDTLTRTERRAAIANTSAHRAALARATTDATIATMVGIRAGIDAATTIEQRARTAAFPALTAL
jgi:hypothetical protein